MKQTHVLQSYVEIEDFPSQHISIASPHSCGTKTQDYRLHIPTSCSMVSERHVKEKKCMALDLQSWRG